jgi:molybdate transport system permease protein
LVPLALPLAWWLARSPRRWSAPVAALVALPLILPPTVIGFYLLVAFGRHGPIGALLQHFDLPTLAFTFEGIVIGSMVYSLPFAVQPLRDTFARVPVALLDAAETLGASRWQRFWHVALPQARGGLWTALVLTFAHTVGEFGVVAMIGGSIPGQTRVVSIAIYDASQALDYAQAARLSLVMLGFAFVVLLAFHWITGRTPSTPKPD